MNDSDARSRQARTDAADERRISAIVQREIRETFKTGLPGGRYGSFLWDGMKIVGASAGGLTIDAVCTLSSSQTVLGDTTPYRVNFNTVVYDPLAQVTTGASWAFTAAAAGTYLVFASVPLNIAGGVDWVTADRADLTIQGTVSRTLATWTGIGVVASPADLTLEGFRGVTLAATNTLYIRVVQDCGTDRTIDTAIANIIIAHV